MPKRFHAFTDNDALGYGDAWDVRQSIFNKEITSAEVFAAMAERARMAETHINAIAHPCYDDLHIKALSTRLRYQDSPFMGMPIFIKENTAFKGMPIQFGSNALPPIIPKKNSPMSNLLVQMGFVVAGTSRMPEFGFNASTESQYHTAVTNPWGDQYSVGGSSGGAAALVAAGVVPIAHANDGGGSIRIPAAAAGLVGLKPTRGRLPTNQMSKGLPIDIVVDGVLTRSVRDTVFFYQYAGQYFNSNGLAKIQQNIRPLQRSLRIGYTTSTIAPIKVDEHQQQGVLSTVKKLEQLGHYVEPFDLNLPSGFRDDFLLYWSYLAYMLTKTAPWMLSRKFSIQGTDQLTQALARHFQTRKFKLIGAVQRLKKVWHDYERMCMPYDVVVMPVLAHHTPLLGELNPAQEGELLMQKLLEYVAFTPIHNITGHPALAIPTELSELGMPVGVMLSGAYGHEALLLQLGMQIESAFPFPSIYTS